MSDTPEPDVDCASESEKSRPLHDGMLFAACASGDELLVRALLLLGADLNAETPKGLTPLVVATVNGHADIVEILLREGATVSMRSLVPAVTVAGKAAPPGRVAKLLAAFGAANAAFVDDALVFAVAEGCPHTVAELLRLGADPNGGAPNGTALGLQPLLVASERGQADLVRLLVAARACLAQGVGSQLTPLAVAARNGHAEAVEVLLENDTAVDSLDTALVFASKMGHEAVAARLLQFGRSSVPEFGPSALRLAVMDGCGPLIGHLLAARVHPDDTSPRGLSALLAASERGMEAVVGQLLEAKADVRTVTAGGLTPLVVASVNGHAGVVDKLLAAGADVGSAENISAVVLAGKHHHATVVAALLHAGAQRRPEFPTHALLFAIAEGCAHTVRLLLANGVDVNHTNKDGTTFLMAAAERGGTEIVGLLLKAGAQVNAMAFNLTALAVASRNGHCDVVERLLDAHADVATYDTALLFAGKNAHVEVVEAIVRAGFRLTFRPENGSAPFCESALRLAISSNCACAVECLLRNGALADDGHSPPPLMIASERGLVPLVELLIKAGADPNTSTDNGVSALVVAAVNGHQGVVTKLLELGAQIGTGDNIQAIVLAGKYGHLGVVDCLIEAGQREGADFGKALLSAIVDNCQAVVVRLLHCGACSAQLDNDMPLRLAFHQHHHSIVGHLLAAQANLQQARYCRIFGTNGVLLQRLSALVVGPGCDATSIIRLLHPRIPDDLAALPAQPWWEGPPPVEPWCFLRGCQGLLDVHRAPFQPALAALKHHPDLPGLTDVLGPVLCHAAGCWHERLYPLLPGAARRLVRHVLLAWMYRNALEGLTFDLLRVVFGLSLIPEMLLPEDLAQPP